MCIGIHPFDDPFGIDRQAEPDPRRDKIDNSFSESCKPAAFDAATVNAANPDELKKGRYRWENYFLKRFLLLFLYSQVFEILCRCFSARLFLSDFFFVINNDNIFFERRIKLNRLLWSEDYLNS